MLRRFPRTLQNQPSFVQMAIALTFTILGHVWLLLPGSTMRKMFTFLMEITLGDAFGHGILTLRLAASMWLRNHLLALLVVFVQQEQPALQPAPRVSTVHWHRARHFLAPLVSTP